MTTFSGTTGATIDYIDTTNQSINLEDDAVPEFGPYELQDDMSGGALTNNVTAEGEEALTGELGYSGSGTDNFYYRFHIIPTEVDAGNLVTTQTHAVQVWNAWLDTKTLDSISEELTTGMTLTPPGAMPLTFPGLELLDFELEINEVGPALIDGTYTFEFSTGESITLTTLGQRVFAWAFRPNWARGIEERLEWVTDIMTAHNGKEQRMGLRAFPRRVLSYEFMIENNSDRRKFEAQLFNWGAKTWMVPIWMEGEAFGAALPAGTTSVTLARVSGDYKVGGDVMITNGAFDFEAMQVDSIAGNVVTFTTPTLYEWPAHAVISPAATAVLDSKQELTRFNGDTEYGRCTLRLLETEVVPAESPTLYRGHPIITAGPEWSREITNDYLRKLQVIDFRTGKFQYEDQAEMPFQIFSHNWIQDGKDEIDALRTFLYARAGKHKAVWLPTFTPDIELRNQYQSIDTYMDVEHGKISQHLWGHVNRKDIMIETVGGNTYYRRITDVEIIDDDTERLTISSALGETLDPEDVRRISWISMARLDSDQITLLWRHDDWVECTQNWRTIRDDV